MSDEFATDARPRSERRNLEGPVDIDEGWYLYCAVSVDPGVTDARTERDDLPDTGLKDEPLHLLTDGEVGVVAHPCDGRFDSADPAEIKRWLLAHQSVVDDVGGQFGTPLPFQFGTIIRGDDDAVRSWLKGERDRLVAALSTLDGFWEYRVDILRREPIPESEFDDEQLSGLAGRIEDASEGTAHLLEKRYVKRLDELRRGRRNARRSRLCKRLDEHAREVLVLDRRPGHRLGGDDEESARSSEPSVRLTLLADESGIDAVGSILEEVADEDHVDVRFTGPWPPYSFTPTFDEENGEEAVRGETGEDDASRDQPADGAIESLDGGA